MRAARAPPHLHSTGTIIDADDPNNGSGNSSSSHDSIVDGTDTSVVMTPSVVMARSSISNKSKTKKENTTRLRSAVIPLPYSFKKITTLLFIYLRRNCQLAITVAVETTPLRRIQKIQQ